MSYKIGIDIGGTTIKAGIFSTDSQLIERTRVKSYDKHNSAAEVLDHIIMAIDLLRSEAALRNLGKLAGIGIGVPGFINRHTGKIYSSANLGLKNINLKVSIEEKVGVPCYIFGDAKVGALAEKYYGAGQHVSSLLYVTLGTGVGSGIIIDSRIYEGEHLLAGEIGHTIVDPVGRPCGCGRRGCLETLVSGPKIVEFYRQYGNNFEGTAEAVAQRATAGDPQALLVYREAMRVLALALANYVTVFDPSLIIIGGGLSLAGAVLFDPLREFYARYTVRDSSQVAPIVPALLGDSSGLLGAQLLVKTDQEN